MKNLRYLEKIGREINRRLLEVERVSHNSGLSGDSIQRVVQPTVTDDGEKAPALKFGQPRVMALFLALTLFHHLIDGFHNRHLRNLVVDRRTSWPPPHDSAACHAEPVFCSRPRSRSQRARRRFCCRMGEWSYESSAIRVAEKKRKELIQSASPPAN